MAIQGKKAYKLYLDEENVEYLREYFQGRKNSGSLSDFIDKYLERSVKIAKLNRNILDDIEPGKMTVKKFWKLCKMEFPT